MCNMALIVVYKDEMLMNQLKKIIETGDEWAGLQIVSWDEKFWLSQKKMGAITNKILFLDKIKGTDKLIPFLDNKFNQYGVRYGWAGNQAVLYTDVNALKKRDDYTKFSEILKDYPIPDMIKKPQNLDSESYADRVLEWEEEQIEKYQEKNIKKLYQKTDIKELTAEEQKEIREKAEKFIETALFARWAKYMFASKAEDLFRNRSAVKRQMLFYGVVNFCNDGLKAFLEIDKDADE